MNRRMLGVLLTAVLPTGAAWALPAAKTAAGIARRAFGATADGQAIEELTLTNAAGMQAAVITYGATLRALRVPDRRGRLADVVLGFDDLQGYLGEHPHFGGIVGRVANRIAQGRFVLDGVTYKLAINNGPNSLHGGIKGFDRGVWRATPLPAAAGRQAVRLEYDSVDGEEGFPGGVHVAVTYTLTDAQALLIDYVATSSKPTPLNLTNHSYFNLGGVDAGAGIGRGMGLATVHAYELEIAAERYTPTDATMIPSGELRPVARTPLDFRRPTPIGRRFAAVMAGTRGYDHNFVLNGAAGGRPRFASRVRDPASGRSMEVRTTQPGMQLYTANFLDGSIRGKGGVAYSAYQALCLETQHYPDAVHHPQFPSVILRPGEVYRQTTEYRFASGG